MTDPGINRPGDMSVVVAVVVMVVMTMGVVVMVVMTMGVVVW